MRPEERLQAAREARIAHYAHCNGTDPAAVAAFEQNTRDRLEVSARNLEVKCQLRKNRNRRRRNRA